MLLTLLTSIACVSPSPGPADSNRDSAVRDSETAQESLPDSRQETAGETSGDDTHADTDTVDTGPTLWRSALYPEDWTPDTTDRDGHFLHDFSYAGYHAGEADLPNPVVGAVFRVTDYGADASGASDSTAAVQAAIDAAVATGSAAVVDFPAGTFRFEGTLSVTASHIVLRGAGSASSFLYFTRSDGMSDRSHITFSGTITQGADHLLATDAENRSMAVTLTDVSGLNVGDHVAVGWTITDAFTEEHGMTGVWVSFTDQWKTMFRRTITAIDPASGKVTLDVPLRYPAKLRDNASLRVETGYLTEVGIQDVSVSTVNDWTTAWTVDRTHAIGLVGVRDGWISHVKSWESPLSTDGRGKHLMSGGVLVQDSRRVTVADCDLENAQNRGDSGNGYLYEVMRSSEVLTRDSVGKNGRHNFIQNWDFGTSGCVWLRTESSGGHSYYADWDPIGWNSYSEFHHSLAMANLIDQSTATDGWQAVNRQTESSGAGHSATETVWWNTSGGGYLRSLQYGDGYVIGTDGMDVHADPTEWDWNSSGEGTDPEDWTEGLDAASTLEPASLYEDQLSRRLTP